MDLKLVLDAVLKDYILPISGLHGIAHWARVLENGRRLAAANGADLVVVSLFAVLHDSRRVNEGHDPDHGSRAAKFARKLRGREFELEDSLFNTLTIACAGHTHELTHPDLTVQTCWDSDRLDLGRVGITPHPARLCTDVGRLPETIRWADGRAQFDVVPDLVRSEWHITLPDSSH